MLAPAHRLTSAADFREVVRRGRRAGGRVLVVHVTADQNAHPGDPARVGFVVSKAVGNAVTRNRVKRRLRHLARERIELLPPGSRVVVRALPPAATSTWVELGEELDRGLHRCLERLRPAVILGAS